MNVDRTLRMRTLAGGLIVAGLTGLAACSGGAGNEPWSAKNADIIKQNKITGRERKVPTTGVPVVMEAGKPVPANTLKKVDIAQGVTANLAWGPGHMIEALEMQPGASSPEEKLAEEAFTAVQEGSVTCTADGKTLELGPDTVLYLTPGMTRSLKAGASGAKVVEVFSPVSANLLKLAGVTLPSGAKLDFPDQGVTANVPAAQVIDLRDIQLAPISAVDPGAVGQRAGANSRLVWGKNVMLSFIRMDPGSKFGLHIHPETQLMYSTRGIAHEVVMDAVTDMTGEAHHTVLLPGGMVHGATMSDMGADAIDTFWPPRPDYAGFAKKQNDAYAQVIAPGTKVAELAKGFTFAEGITWLKGKLYFSDMWFKNPAKGDWTGSPARSRLIAMEPDGKFKVLSQGAQTNGTIAAANGNLIVCNMFGHKVVEVDPATGKVVRTVLEQVNGKPIDGPNDMVMDAKGGIYITDPQFTAETKKSQPGKQVYYVAPDGSAKVVVPAGEFAMPNGVELSPDGKTLYVNNTWLQPGENYVYAYDVQPDGSVANKRKFAYLNVKGEVMSAPDPVNRFDSRADGSAVDTDGRIYQATLMGVQIFDKNGVYVGTIPCPDYPISITFGGPNNDVLYMVGENKVFSIQTKVKGFRLPAGLN